MIYYITTHSHNIKAAETIKTLFENTNKEFYFVYGRESTEKVSPYIVVDAEESYENLPLKTYFLLEHFLKTDYTHMVKMDDDTYLNVDILENAQHTEDYIGLFVDYTESEINSIYHWYKIQTPTYKIKKRTFNLNYAEGSLYILSKKAAQMAYDRGYEFYSNTPETYLGEDNKIGISLEHDTISRKDITKQWVPLYETSEDLSIIHPVYPKVIDILKKCNTNEEKLDILRRYKLFNDNARREIFLKTALKKLRL